MQEFQRHCAAPCRNVSESTDKSGSTGALLLLRGLNEAEDVAVGISDVELSPVRHISKIHRDGCSGCGEFGDKHLGIGHPEAGIQILCRLKCLLIPSAALSTLQVDATAIAQNARVEPLVLELQVEAKAVPVVRDGSPQI